MKAIRRRVERLLQEYCVGAPVAVEPSDDVLEREAQMMLRFGTQDEISELLEIAEREMTGDGDEARLDAIHDAIEARAESSSWAWTRRRV
ncbi:hypothetical protein [Burkholderia contaminans]|uniref:Uncharacterized protein n=1 Tax=Burkholderia contaminans TaxID=488447 RepID=A0A6P2Z4R6_9BURK|nr:hypothetical protein [Burkholderia contaminans]VWD26179.1 hypothetical protein BCO71033_03534 [Burkholderia contaminans]